MCEAYSNRKMSGAFLGDVICMEMLISVKNLKVKISYRVCCKSRCTFILKNKVTREKFRITLQTDNKWHIADIHLPEIGEYYAYVSNVRKDYVQYEIQFRSI